MLRAGLFVDLYHVMPALPARKCRKLFRSNGWKHSHGFDAPCRWLTPAKHRPADLQAGLELVALLRWPRRPKNWFVPITKMIVAPLRPCATGSRSSAQVEPTEWMYLAHNPAMARRMRRSLTGLSRSKRLSARLTADVPADPAQGATSSKPAGSWRILPIGIEGKTRPFGGNYFRLATLSAEELLEERAGLSS